MFIKVTQEAQGGATQQVVVAVEHIVTIKEHTNNKHTIISVLESEYAIWATESMDDIVDMLREAGGAVIAR